MDWQLRQVDQWELGRSDLHRLAFLPYRYTAHQVACTYLRHWTVWTLTLGTLAGLLACGWAPLVALTVSACLPVYVYVHSRAADWLVIQRRQPDYRDFSAVWQLPHRVYVAECTTTKQLLGLACLQRTSETECDLQHAAVLRRRRRNGLGRRLVEHAIAEATRLGYSKMTLYSTTVQAPAVSLYQRLGFSVDQIHQEGVFRRIPWLPKPFAYVHMSLRLRDFD